MGRTEKRHKKHYDYDYSIRVKFNVIRGSEREERMLRVSKGLGIPPSAALFDRLLERGEEIIARHNEILEEANRLEKEAALKRGSAFGVKAK
jgi:hypothetical protein